MKMRAALFVSCLAVLCGTSCRKPIETVHASSFDILPVDASWTVSLENEFDADSDLSPRERREQARDWLLAGLVHRFGFDAETVAKSTDAVAAVRVAGVPTGSEEGLIRSAWVGGGEVIVLLPPGTPEQQFDYLAEVADRMRGRLDGPAKLLRPFEYVLEHGETLATIRCLAPRDEAEFYGPESLYTERTIRGLGDVETFLGEIADLTWASLEKDDLVLGGRRLKAAPYRSLDIGRLAAFYQADRTARGQFRERREEVRTFNRQWGEVRYSTEEELAQKRSQREKAWSELSARLEAEQAAAPRLPCGFSLDGVPTSRPEYQRATYFCPGLAGTEAAMTFFYGDLLAKLWAFDYAGSTPKHILGFRPFLEIRVPKALESDVDELSHTRIWFGPLQTSVVERDKQLALSRTVTRVFAKSSMAGHETEEQAPNPAAAAFIGWWSDHFAEIAAWEPEYQRLNQLMKWAFLFGWLEHADADQRLDCLYQVPVKRDLWFPDWVRQAAGDLRFQQWDGVEFHERGYRGNDAETMVVLSSKKLVRSDREEWLEGGVGTPSTADFDKPHPFPSPALRGTPHEVTARPAEAALLDTDSTYRDVGPSLRVETHANGNVIGSVDIHTTPDGFWTVAGNRSAIKAQRLENALAANEGTGESRFDQIGSFPGVGICLKLPEGEGYLVRFQGGENRWLRVGDTSTPKPGPDVWVSGDEVARLAQLGNEITVLPRPEPLSGLKVEIHNRGPPQGESVQLSVGDRQVRATRDASGGLHLPRGEIPRDLTGDLQSLRRLTAASEAADLIGLMSEGDYSNAGELLASKPEVANQVRAARDRELTTARDEMKNGGSGNAVDRLERLARAFPEDPEVLGTLAVAHAQDGDLRRAAASLNGAGRAAPLDDVSLSRLLDPIPAHSPLRDAVGAVLGHTGIQGEISVIESPGGLDLKLQVPRGFRLTPWSKERGAPPYGAVPGYFSPEWIPPLNQSLPMLPGVAVPDNLLQLSPLVIEDPFTGERWWRMASPAK